jgi:hypothetical protein
VRVARENSLTVDERWGVAFTVKNRLHDQMRTYDSKCSRPSRSMRRCSEKARPHNIYDSLKTMMIYNNCFAAALLSLLLLTSYPYTTKAGSAWAPLGQTLCNNADELLGSSVALAEDGSTGETSFVFAVGSPKYSSRYLNQGKVEVYRFNGTDCLWIPNGEAVTGEKTEDQLGTKVSLSCDGSIMAASGDTAADLGNESKTGFVQVYELVDGSWSPFGSTIRPDLPGTNFGFNMEISCDGRTLAVGAFGYAQVYQYVNGDWTLKGDSISGEGFMLVALSRDGTIIATGELGLGVVQAYSYATTGGAGAWLKFGNDMTPTVPDIPFPQGIAISDDGSRVVVSCPGWSNSGQQKFGALVFDFSGSVQVGDGTWSQVGDTFATSGESISADSSIDISGDGMIVVMAVLVASGSRFLGTWSFVGGLEWLRLSTKAELPLSSSDKVSVAVSASGSLFAIGAFGEEWDSWPVGAAMVHFAPDSGIPGCLPDPAALDPVCSDLGPPEDPYPDPDEDEDEDEDEVTIIHVCNCNCTFPDGRNSSLALGAIEDENDDLSSGAVAGIVVGSTAFLALWTVLVLFVYKHMRQKKTSAPLESQESARL